jgi:hypothetical protein
MKFSSPLLSSPLLSSRQQHDDDDERSSYHYDVYVICTVVDSILVAVESTGKGSIGEMVHNDYSKGACSNSKGCDTDGVVS